MISSLFVDVQNLITGSLPDLQERRFDITWKMDNSPVTAADVFLESLIADLLSDRLPDLAFIGEESWQEGGSVNCQIAFKNEPVFACKSEPLFGLQKPKPFPLVWEEQRVQF